jgi:flagellar motor switch protein FliN
MEFIHPEFIEALNNQRQALAEHISAAMTEEPEQAIQAEVIDIGTVKTADLYGDLAAPLLSIQFGFASIPEHQQVFLIQDETLMQLASYVKGEAIEAIDENLVSDIRTTLEAIVQGTCLAAGKIRTEPVVATNLAIRHQLFSFPPNLQRVDELIRVQIALQGHEPLGSMIWVLDADTAATIVVPPGSQEGEESPFLQMEQTGAKQRQQEDASGLELLMDIPLVELGMGSIVEIDKAAGEPVDVMVNGRVVAKGEVVVIEDNFGVRITEILTPQERLARLGEVA